MHSTHALVVANLTHGNVSLAEAHNFYATGKRMHKNWKRWFPWFSRKCTNDMFHVGCSVCAAAGLNAPWAQFRVCQQSVAMLQRKDLAQHATTNSHKQAAQAIMGNANDGIVPGAPDAKVFYRCIADRRRFTSWRESDKSYCAKEGRLIWCVAEAL